MQELLFQEEKAGAEDKINKMEESGITVAKSPSIIGKTLFNKLSN
jgi:succinyl-CoA synthetase alpha subunit